MKYTIEKDRVLTYFVNTGAAGKTGERGPMGPAGPRGETGSVGPAGDRGPKGDTGSQGPAGDRGPAGEPGYTPVKGVDYWTDGDREQIVNEVLQQIPNLNEESF